jgi:hypothetical protein
MQALDLAGLPSYQIDATFDPELATIRAQEILRFPNPGAAALGEIVFRLLPNATSIYGGGSLAIQGIWRGAEPVPWTVSPDQTILTVLIEPALGVGETIELALGYELVVPRVGSGYKILHQSSAVTSLAGWYPILAPYEGGWQAPSVPTVGDANHFDIALYDVTFRAPTAYALASTGVTLSRFQEGDLSVWRLASGPARSFALALSDRFQVLTAQRDNVTVNYYALPSGPRERSPQEALQIALDALQVFDGRFGAYPYTEFDVVETQVTIGGYEFAGMVFIAAALRASGDLERLRFIVSHEVAHQWWYALVGSDSVEEPWLDEALATYSVAIYYEDTYGAGAGRSMVSYFRGQGGNPTGAAPGINVSALDYDSWAAYRGRVYYQGALFLDALRQEMGDDAFFAMLREYTREHRFGSATTAEFAALARQFAGRPLDSLFLSWFGVAEPGI